MTSLELQITTSKRDPDEYVDRVTCWLRENDHSNSTKRSLPALAAESSKGRRPLGARENRA